MNATAAREWLNKAWHHLSAAQKLRDIGHYTDIIAIEVHYSLELICKSFFAFENRKIPRTHELYELYIGINGINLTDYEIKQLIIATDYHIQEAYPSGARSLPELEEIDQLLQLADKLLEEASRILKVSYN